MALKPSILIGRRSTAHRRSSQSARRKHHALGNGIERLESRHMLARVSIVAEDPIASELGDVGLFRIFLSEANSADTIVTFQIGGEATPNADYQGIGTNIVIPANTMSATIPLNAIDDALPEGGERVIITLTGTSNPNDTIDAQRKSATVNIVDNEFNLPPAVIANTGSTTTEGGIAAITAAQLNSTDPDTPTSALVYAVATGPANGTVRLNGAPAGAFTQADVNAGRVSYLHNGSETIRDAFTFNISDGINTIRGNTFNFTITPVNDAPIVVNPIPDQAAVEDSAPTNINVSGVFADTDVGDKLSFSVSSSIPGLVNATLAGNILTLTYGPNQAGTATITLTATDTNGTQISDSFEAKVTNVNDPVDARNDSFSSGGNQPLTANVLGNDVDPDNLDADPTNDTLSAALVTGALYGTLTFHANGTFTYTTSGQFSGSDLFTYRAFDGNGSFDDATVLITTFHPNVRPTAQDDMFTVSRNTTLNGNVLANDSDPNGDKLTATLVSQPLFSHGRVTLQSDGDFTFTPVSGFVGTTTFEYIVEDHTPPFPGSDLGVVTINVTIPNRPPDAKNDLFATGRNTAVQINFLANDVDPDGDTLRVIAVGAPTHGQLSLGVAGVATYLPNHNFLGTDSFTYTISDDRGATDIGTVNVFVESPGGVIATNDTFTVNEDTIGNPLDVVMNDFDTNGDALKVTAVTQPSMGVVEIGPNGGNVLYMPNPNFIGRDVFTYTASNARGESDTASVTVTAVNVDTDLQGTVGDDVFLVRRGPSGTNVQVFSNDAATGTPLFSMPITAIDSLLFEMLAGDDRVIFDFAIGSPLPGGGIRFLGGENGPAGDRLIVRNAGFTHGAYRANGLIAGDGIVTIDGRNIVLTSVEPIEIAGLDSFTVVTPNADDTLSAGIDVIDGTTFLAGKSGAVMLSPVSVSNVSTFIIDAAANDAGAGNDSLTISTSGVIPHGLSFLQYRSGTGANTLTIQGGTARIDSTRRAERNARHQRRRWRADRHPSLPANLAHAGQRQPSVGGPRRHQRRHVGAQQSQHLRPPPHSTSPTTILSSSRQRPTSRRCLARCTTASSPAMPSGAWNGNGLISSAAQGNPDTTLCAGRQRHPWD